MVTLSKTKFRVEIQGMDGLGAWTAVRGVKYGHKATRVYSDHSKTPATLPGKGAAGPIVLTRVFDGNKQLAAWAAEQAKSKRTGSIIFVDFAGEEQMRFNWSNGWVSDYELGDMDATAESEGPVTETITIQVEDIFPG